MAPGRTHRKRKCGGRRRRGRRQASRWGGGRVLTLPQLRLQRRAQLLGLRTVPSVSRSP